MTFWLGMAVGFPIGGMTAVLALAYIWSRPLPRKPEHGAVPAKPMGAR